MAVYQIDPLQDPRWAELVERHPRASVFHTCGWLESLRRTYGYEPLAFTTSAPGRQLANGIVFCHVRSWITGSRLVSLPFSDHCEPLIDASQDGREIATALVHRMRSEKWNYIEIRPLYSDANAALEGSQFCQEKTFRFHSLDLTPSIEDLFCSCNKSNVQRKIRRAEREGLQYKEGRSGELLAEFYRLLLLTRRRHQAPPQPIAWFRNLAQYLGEGLKIRLASVAGRAVASILTLCHKGTMVYKYGCSDLQFSNLGGTALLFWQMIRDAKHKGCHTVDLGRSDDYDEGLIRFKNNWGASDQILPYWRHPVAAATNKLAPWKKGITRHLIAGLPDRLLVAVGDAIYRHMG